jgi:hypothetical protein
MYDKDNIFFEDIKDYRNNTSFHESSNMIEIDQILSKEIEKETMASTRIKTTATKSIVTGVIGSLLNSGVVKQGSLKIGDLMMLANDHANTDNAPTARSISSNADMKIFPSGELLTAHKKTTSGLDTDEEPY